MKYLIVLAILSLASLFVYMKKRVCFKIVILCMLFFMVVSFVVNGFYSGIANLTEHSKLSAISIALCEGDNDLGNIYCGPEYFEDGVTITIMESDKVSELTKSKINKIINRAIKLKPVLTDKKLKLLFTKQIRVKIEKDNIGGNDVTKHYPSYSVYKKEII